MGRISLIDGGWLRAAGKGFQQPPTWERGPAELGVSDGRRHAERRLARFLYWRSRSGHGSAATQPGCEALSELFIEDRAVTPWPRSLPRHRHDPAAESPFSSSPNLRKLHVRVIDA